jgi:hypothetical protein
MNVGKSSKTLPLHNCSTTSTSSASSSSSAEHSSSASSSSADRSPSRDNVTNGKETVHLNDSVNSYDAGSPIAEFNEFKPVGDLTKQLAGTLDLNKVMSNKNHLFFLINQIIKIKICFYFYSYAYTYFFFKST